MTRELIPFRVVDAEGNEHKLMYSSPYEVEGYDKRRILKNNPWFEHGKPTKNWMLHETDFYDEVDKTWGTKWGAEGIGRLREVLVSRPTENETRSEYAEEWQYYYSTSGGKANQGESPSGAGRWLDSRHFVFNESVVCNEEGEDDWILCSRMCAVFPRATYRPTCE